LLRALSPAAVAVLPAHDRPGGHPAAKVGGPPGRDNRAVADHRHPVRELCRLFQVVGGEQHRDPAVGQRADHVPERVPGGGVEPGRRLVKEEQLRPADQAERDVEPPHLATGQRAYPRAGLVGQPDQVDHLSRPPRRWVELREVPDHLGDGQLRRVGPELQYDADPRSPGPPRPLRVRAEHADLAAIAFPVALEDLDRRGLARPIRP
jgi:hypothetical protein